MFLAPSTMMLKLSSMSSYIGSDEDKPHNSNNPTSDLSMIDPMLRPPDQFNFSAKLMPCAVAPPELNNWLEDLHGLQSQFILSTQLQERARQISAIYELKATLSFDHIPNQQFQWMIYSSGPIREEWLPIYAPRFME